MTHETWTLNAQHAIETWYETSADTATWLARCTCGWHSSSGSAGARNWNVEGHAKDIREGKR